MSLVSPICGSAHWCLGSWFLLAEVASNPCLVLSPPVLPPKHPIRDHRFAMSRRMQDIRQASKGRSIIIVGLYYLWVNTCDWHCLQAQTISSCRAVKGVARTAAEDPESACGDACMCKTAVHVQTFKGTFSSLECFYTITAETLPHVTSRLTYR